jgi:hypothetical protein
MRDEIKQNRERRRSGKIILPIAAGLICAIIIRTVFSRPAKAAPTGKIVIADMAIDPPSPLAPQSGQQLETRNEKLETPLAAASPAATAAPALPAIAQYTTPPLAKPVYYDDKTIIPDEKDAKDKSVLPPVGEFINNQPAGLNVDPGGAPAEYLGVNNKLLSPPSPPNTSGPVVSAETK